MQEYLLTVDVEELIKFFSMLVVPSVELFLLDNQLIPTPFHALPTLSEPR